MEEEDHKTRAANWAEAWSMTMPDNRGPMIPDLEWFDRMFSPDADEREHLRELAEVYGEEHILTREQVRAEKRRQRAPEIRELRRKWRSRNEVYGKQDDYGSF